MTPSIPPRRRRPTVTSWCGRAAAVAAVALLLFHAELLVAQALDGRLLEPATLLRWTLGGLVLAGFAALRRVGMPVIRGREAGVLWLLVILLHGPAVSSWPARTEDVPPLAATLATTVVAMAGVTLVGALALAWLARRRAHTALRAGGGRLGSTVQRRRMTSPFRLALAPRPPPVR